MDDLKSSIYDDSINDLIQNLHEHLKFKSNNSSRCNLSSNSALNQQEKSHSPYYSPNNSLSSTASDLIQQNSSINCGVETYFVMQHLIQNGNLIKEAVRRLKFSGNQQIATDQNQQTATNLKITKQY